MESLKMTKLVQVKNKEEYKEGISLSLSLSLVV